MKEHESMDVFTWEDLIADSVDSTTDSDWQAPDSKSMDRATGWHDAPKERTKK